MIRTSIIMENGEIQSDVPLSRIKEKDVKWYWVDFSEPSSKDIRLLKLYFRFHPLAIEDCLDDFSQRPKLDFYDQYIFVLMHGINTQTLDSHEVNMFVNSRFIVTFHKEPVSQLNQIWGEMEEEGGQLSPFKIMHRIVDRLVDDYFPLVYKIEDRLNTIEDNTNEEADSDLMDELFDIRHDMSKLRRILVPMRDLLYRISNSGRLNALKEEQLYFNDVYDHLIKLVEMLESYREFSSDIRDNYLSINSDKMNNIMMTLTVITTIFMPLTFIAGLYGMNFVNMPELDEPNGYFIVLGIMGLVALIMFGFFLKIGWLRFGSKKRRKRRRLLRLK
ncbi:magnesium/cobalt transporter CorA [Rossellomorea vietnamensis]|uniref:Magnesium/cobalt transporter CorA n=1 Tax=Rossellomorea vietnamensis TaxID=218284 RepID=A0ACD4CDE9_9BACI|nr:magnesium/cobalt transporter CorA [Rossellomorea vietnamensis]UXH45612.1 magnesium/cobalt transporter CorA [Rossellomorea vietnamensis]